MSEIHFCIESPGIFAGDGEGFFGNIDGCNTGLRDQPGQCDGDAAAAGADVEYGGIVRGGGFGDPACGTDILR